MHCCHLLHPLGRDLVRLEQGSHDRNYRKKIFSVGVAYGVWVKKNIFSELFLKRPLMVPYGYSVLLYMRPFHTITTALLAASFAVSTTAIAGAPSPAETIPGYSRDANGIAMAVTELLPSIDNCVAAHEALGGASDVSLDIAFSVSKVGEVAGLTIDTQDIPNTGIDSCIEGTLSAMRFAPGTQEIPVHLPLTASAQVKTALK